MQPDDGGSMVIKPRPPWNGQRCLLKGRTAAVRRGLWTLTFLNEAPEVAGRPCIAFRRPERVALEDKILIDLGYLPHRGA
jgi:hypothetical protein